MVVQRSVHRTILIVDVEGFGDRRRTNRHQVAVRGGLYRIVAAAFREAGIPWDIGACEDRGDGIFMLLPPEVPKSLLVESLPPALVANLRAHNAASPPPEQIRLRMALHAGEITYDEHGVTAASINLAFRLIDAAPLKGALAASPGVLAIIASAWFYEDVVRHSTAEANRYRAVTVVVKETTATAWICLPDHRLTDDDVAALHLPTRVPVALAGLPADEGFVGRHEDVSVLTALLAPGTAETGPVLVSTVAGLAGVGKTALAVRVARQATEAGWFPGGVLFVDLHGYDHAGYVDPSAAVAAMLRALGVEGDRIPPSPGEREALYRSELAAMAARGERVLVIADNASSVEHALALRPGSAAHRMIVTSRHTLPVPGARRVEVDVLPQGESVAVIAQALRLAHPGDDRILAEPDAAAELARLCGHLPLALRIAAELLADEPHQRISNLVGILAQATDRLDELAYGDSVGVRVALDASYQNLRADHARVFRLMALHPGPQVSVAAAAALIDMPAATARRLLDDLRRAHLIQAAAAPGCYRFHDLLRLYATRRCDAEETPATRAEAIDRLLTYYWETILAAEPHLNPRVSASERLSRFSDRMDAVAWLEKERPNLTAIVRLAADVGKDTYVRDIPLVLQYFFYLRRHLDEWLSTAAAALAATRRLGDRFAECRALNSIGTVYVERREWTTARDILQQSLAISRADHDRFGEATTLVNLGNIHHQLHEVEECLDYYHQSIVIYQEIGERYHEGQAWNNIGYLYGSLGRQDDAISSYERSLAIFRDVDDVHGQATALTNLGTCYQALNRFDDAIECHQRALVIFQETGDQLREARALANLGATYEGRQRGDEGLAYYHRALVIFGEIGDKYGEGTTLASLAAAYLTMRRTDEAIGCYQQALAAFEQANAVVEANRIRSRIAELTSSSPT